MRPSEKGLHDCSQEAWVMVRGHVCSATGWLDEELPVSREIPLVLRVDGRDLRRFVCSPGLEKELAAGYLCTLGLIRSPSDIVRMEVNDGWIEMETRWATTAGLGREECETPVSGQRFAARVLGPAAELTYSKGGLYKVTHGSHAAALFSSEGQLLVMVEDIGRHNAVDKVVGSHLLAGGTFASAFLVVTCRLSAEMIDKAANAGLSLILTRGVPTAEAIDRAVQRTVVAAGQYGPSRLVVYSGVDRVLLDW